MGEEERTGPMWYLRLTKLDEPSNFLEVERDFRDGGSFGLMISGLISRV